MAANNPTMESFFSHQKYRWLWLNLAFIFICCFFYFFPHPSGGQAGDTVYGYTLGALATLGIVYLMWYGIRKRSYHASKTTLKGWLAGHIWLGISLLIIVPLHSGFQMGFNIHSFAYVVMVVVILSGIWGALNYKTLAAQIQSHRGGAKPSELVEQLHLITKETDQQLTNKSDELLVFANQIDFKVPKTIWALCFRTIPPLPSAVDLQSLLKNFNQDDQAFAIDLLKLSDKKHSLAMQLQKEIRTKALLRLWLLIHLPLSIILVLTVTLHIILVFLYR